MNFRTQIPIPPNLNPIDYNSKIVSLGSCFAVNMAEKFEYYKFQNSVNPFGIIFNPVSIEKLIYRIVNQVFFTEKDIFFHKVITFFSFYSKKLSLLLTNINLASK